MRTYHLINIASKCPTFSILGTYTQSKMYILKNTGKTSIQKHMQNIEGSQTFSLLFLCRITMQNNAGAKGLDDASESHTLLRVETVLPVMLKYLGLSY